MGIRRCASLICLLTALVALSHPVCAQTRVLDEFETLSGWKAIHSHGDASKIRISSAKGRTGKGLLMEFAFIGYMGSVSIEKQFGQDLPSNYQLSFDIRSEAPVNNLVVRLKDSLGNVWWINRTNYEFPRTWSKFSIKKYQVQYGWGPSMGGELHRLDKIEIMIDVVNGGKGKVWFDNFALEAIDDSHRTAPRVTASSSAPDHEPAVSPDGRTVANWMSDASVGREEYLQCDFGSPVPLGGLVIDWEKGRAAREFRILISNDAKKWTPSYAVTRGTGHRNYIYLKEAEGRYLRLALTKAPGAAIGIARLEIRDPDFSFSPNEFFRSIAAMEPKGYYPRYFLQQQSYWTVVGVPGDVKEALVNEQGMIETDKLSFSLEPFLYLDSTLITWNDVAIDHSLDDRYLPIPTVSWTYKNDIRLDVTALVSGVEDSSVLLVRYRITNLNAARRTGTLFVAARPFQVNPPWQTFTIIGGASHAGRITCTRDLAIDKKIVIPLTAADDMGAAEFDAGHVTEFLKEGSVPPFKTVVDHSGYASAALRYEFALSGGQDGDRTRHAVQDVIIAVPFHSRSAMLTSGMDARRAAALFDSAHAAMQEMWRSKLNTVALTLPASASDIVNTIKTNLGYVLINADKAGTQPGSRSYERSWIRDGSLTSTAFLQMGITGEVRRYLDWYATFQFADGSIPAVVERGRGPERVPEHDSHGQFIYAVREYFAFTHDTVWLRGKWPAILKTVRHIQALRAERKTDRYKHGTPIERACYGLVPESISHEGYSWMPQHSYWDDFFILRGLKDAVEIARTLGHAAESKEFALERDDFRTCLYNSIRAAMEIKQVKYIPGCVELGDFSGLSTTIAVTPCDELAHIPHEALTYTFDESYRQFLERKNNTVNWDAYLPYDARFVGAYVYMDRKDRALDILWYLMHDRRPPEWNEWAEVVWKDRDAPRSIGDMPHSWAASDFIRSVRTMFVYEREDDSSLVIGAGIPEQWVNDPSGIGVSGLPTYYGHITYSMKQDGTRITVEIAGDLQIPRGGIVVRSPRAQPITSASGGTLRGEGREVLVRTLPAHLELSY